MKHTLPDQRGVTLLLTVMILAGITLITVTVAYFGIQEFRASRAVVLSEPAISAAFSAGEHGLWAVKRLASIPTCPNLITSNLNDNTIADVCQSFGPAKFKLEPGIPKNLYFYNPEDINGDPEMDGTPGVAAPFPVNYFQTTHLTGSSVVEVTVARIDGTLIDNRTVYNETLTINTPVAPACTDCRMKVTLLSASDATVEVDSNQGILDAPTINAAGCASVGNISDCDDSSENFIRRLNITVPQ